VGRIVRINKREEIDWNKLNKLFADRGHAITIPGFSKIILDVLDGKRDDLEIHQCTCGELMFYDKHLIEQLKQRFGEVIPCTRCGRYEEELALRPDVLSYSTIERLEEITSLMEKAHLKRREAPNILIEVARKSRGLYSTQSTDELGFGFYNLIQELSKNTEPGADPFGASVARLIDAAKKSNMQEFGKLLMFANRDPNFALSLNVTATFTAFNTLKMISQSMQLAGTQEAHIRKEDVVKTEIEAYLSGYKNLVELTLVLDSLLNLVNISRGGCFSPNPFKGATLTPKTRGKLRSVKSLSDKVQFLSQHLPEISLSKLYNTHLRNAIAHNEYFVCIQEQVVELTRYNETLTFNELRDLFEQVSQFHTALHGCFAKQYVESKRESLMDYGIEAVILGYEDFFIKNDAMHPKASSPAEIVIYQFWDYAVYDQGKRYIPKPRLSFTRTPELQVSFRQSRHKFIFPLDDSTRRWLEHVVLHGYFSVSLLTIAPYLPTFSNRAIFPTLLPEDGWIYVIAADETILRLLPDELVEITKHSEVSQ
jgi:hypothetical protein